MDRRGFSLIELLVALAVIALLVAIIIPAVQSARETARKAECASHLRQIGIAIGGYEATHRMFPPGNAYKASLHVALLPFIEQSPLYAKYDFVNRDDAAVRTTVIPLYLCPSDPAPNVWPLGDTAEAATNYAGNFGTGVQKYGYNGMFRHIVRQRTPFPTGPITAADVRDGLSNTAAISEILHADGTYDRLRVNWQTPTSYLGPDRLDEFCAACAAIPQDPTAYGWVGAFRIRGLPWTRGDVGYSLYNHALGPNQPSCNNGTAVQESIISAASMHPGGVNVLFADGHVTLFSNSVDRQIWRDIGSRVESDLAVP